jgi:hypothetical protein
VHGPGWMRKVLEKKNIYEGRKEGRKEEKKAGK